MKDPQGLANWTPTEFEKIMNWKPTDEENYEIGGPEDVKRVVEYNVRADGDD